MGAKVRHPALSFVGSEAAQLAIAKYLYAANLPFRTADDPHFRSMLHLLQPGFKVPARQAIATTLLDKVYSAERSKVMATLANERVTISCDGWSTVTMAATVGICVNDTLLTIKESDSGHTGEYMSGIVEGAIKEVKDEWGCKVVALCSDSASNMVVMRDCVAQNNPCLFVYGCQAHVLNLLIGDYMKDKNRDLVLTNVTLVLKTFKNSTLLSQSLKVLKVLKSFLV